MNFKFRWIKKLALLLIVVAICLAAVEGIARLALGNEYPMNNEDPETVTRRFLNQTVAANLFQRLEDESVCYDLIPGGKTKILDQNYTINSLGFRGPEFSPKKPANVRRIAVSGDSFVFGWGSDDTKTIPTQMQHKLNKAGAVKYEVINCGVPGYHTGQMKERLLKRVFDFEPDVVIMVVTANDLVKDSLHFNTLFRGLYADLLPLPYTWKPVFWRWSVLYRLFVQKHKAYMERSGQVAFSPEVMAFFSEQVRTVKREAEKRGISFMLVMLPMLEDFYDYPYAKQHEEMHAVLEDLDRVDLMPRMMGLDVRDLWFRIDDHHLNGRANEMVSRMLLADLEKRGMVQLQGRAMKREPLMEPLYKRGDLIVADMDADPHGRGNFPGALFRIDRRTREMKVICADPMFREPVDIIFDAYNNILMLDPLADPLNIGAKGAVFRINQYSGRADVVLSSERFGFPNAILLGPDDKLYISDKEVDPLGSGEMTGALWVYDLKTRKLDVLAAGPQFISPSPLAFAPNNKLYLIDADANPNEYPGTPGVLFEVDIATGAFEPLIQFSNTVSPVGIIPMEDGRFVVVDANADPLNLGYYLGGLLMVDPVEKTAEFLLGSRKLMDPIRGDLGIDGALYFADGNADPKRLGPDGGEKGVEGRGHGAIWRYDMKKKRLSLVFSDKRFINPACVLMVR